MSEPSDSKKDKDLPVWQTTPAAAEKPKEENTEVLAQDKQEDVSPPPSRPQLVEQAKKFLEEDEIKDAPIDRKISFLETKGLANDEIQELLGVSRNTEASPQDPAAAFLTKREPSPATQNLPASPEPQHQASHVPPIITYPEFLMHQQQPPPLVTTQRLLNTLYLFAATSASIYAANTYLLKPMASVMETARHSLFQTAEAKLTDLNIRLTSIVSTDPTSSAHPHHRSSDDDTASDTSSTPSDPTELFHRDIGIQTTASIASTPSTRAASPVPSAIAPAAPIEAQHTRLSVLKSHLVELSSDLNGLEITDNDTTTAVRELQAFLDGLMYSGQPYYGSDGSFGGVMGGVGLGGVGGASKDTKNGPDMIETVRKEIRSIKGTFLSARNFPAAGRRT